MGDILLIVIYLIGALILLFIGISLINLIGFIICAICFFIIDIIGGYKQKKIKIDKKNKH